MLCRLCLLHLSERAGIPLFDDNSESRLLKMVAKFLHLELIQGDAVSTMICNICCQHLDDFEKFSTYVEERQELLLRHGYSELLVTKQATHDMEAMLDVKKLCSPAEMITNLDAMENNEETLLDIKDVLMDGVEAILQEAPAGEDEEFGCADMNVNDDDDDYEVSDGDDDAGEDNNSTGSNRKKTTDKLLQKLFKVKQSKRSNMRNRTAARRISKSSRRGTANLRATHKKCKNEESPTPPCTSTTTTATVVEANAGTANTNAVHANQAASSPTTDETMNKSKSNYYNEFIAKYMQLKCELCGEFLENFFLLKKHFRDKHQCNGYAMCCDKQFKKRIFLVDHINYHLNPKCFQCKICSKSYKNRSNLDEHLKKVHPKSEHLKYECKMCEKKFARKFDYEKHNLKHQTEKNFICEICNKSFANKLRLSAHLKNMHGDAVNFICNYCGQEYKNKTNFERHVAEHEGIVVAPVQCSICGEWLKSKETLHTHMGTHNRIDAECETCGRICPTKRALTAHIKYMHSTASNLICTFCNKTFKRKGNLNEHMAMHTGEKHHTCMHCNREFRSRANMYTHIKKDHIDEWMKSKLEKSTKLAEISKSCNSSGLIT